MNFRRKLHFLQYILHSSICIKAKQKTTTTDIISVQYGVRIVHMSKVTETGLPPS